jgi:hypothetical protein
MGPPTCIPLMLPVLDVHNDAKRSCDAGPLTRIPSMDEGNKTATLKAE